MVSDATTFFLSFAAVFAGFGLYVWRLERLTASLAGRVAALEALTAKSKPPQSPL